MILTDAWEQFPCQNCGWASPFGEVWPSFGLDAAEWIEENVILGEGDSMGEYIQLRDDQVEFLMHWYEYCRECKWWRFDKFIRGEARGGGKTQFMAAVAALELCGPDHLSPVSPNICVSAASFEQANILFGQLGIIFGGPDGNFETPLNGLCDVLEKRITFCDNRPGKAYRVAAKAGTNEGGQPTLLLADETHEWGEDGDPKARLYTVLSTSTSKRLLRYKDRDGHVVVRGQGRSGMISTAGFDVNHNMLGTAYKKASQARSNPAEYPTCLFDWRECDEDVDWEDPDDRERAIRQASGAADIIWSVKARVRRWGDPEMPRHEYIRYYGNRWVDVSEDSWLVDHPHAWKNCKDVDLVRQVIHANNCPGVVAVDMALRHDSVGVATVRHDSVSGRTIVHPKRFVADSSGKIDHVAVWHYIRREADNLGPHLRGIVYDPRFFEIPGVLLEDEGYLVVQFDQNIARMGPACGDAFSKILAGKFAHPDEYVLNSAVVSASKREQDNGSFTLSKGKSKTRIDLCIAMVMGAWVLEQSIMAPPDRPFNIY